MMISLSWDTRDVPAPADADAKTLAYIRFLLAHKDDEDFFDSISRGHSYCVFGDHKNVTMRMFVDWVDFDNKGVFLQTSDSSEEATVCSKHGSSTLNYLDWEYTIDWIKRDLFDGPEIGLSEQDRQLFLETEWLI